MISISNSEIDISFVPSDERLKILWVSMLKKAKTMSETAPPLKKVGTKDEEEVAPRKNFSTASVKEKRRKSLPPFARLWGTVKSQHSPVEPCEPEETPDIPTHLAVL